MDLRESNTRIRSVPGTTTATRFLPTLRAVGTLAVRASLLSCRDTRPEFWRFMQAHSLLKFKFKGDHILFMGKQR